MHMLLFATAPYLIILLGVCTAFFGIRPKMLAWAMIMVGGLSSLGVTVFLTVTETEGTWPWALIASLPFIAIAANIIKDLRYPRINDVTTDVKRPPGFVAAKNVRANKDRDMSFPPKFGEIINNGYPNLKPLISDKPPMDVFAGVAELMGHRPGWTLTRIDRAEGVIEGEVVTSILRFVDDVIVRIESAEGTTRVDMRSKSREGLVDGGYNAKRIKAFLEDLASELD